MSNALFDMGEISGETIFIDGTKIEASANKYYGNTIKIKHVKKLRKKLYALKETENIVFVHGIGKRKTPLQKSIETLESYLNRLEKYNQQMLDMKVKKTICF